MYIHQDFLVRAQMEHSQTGTATKRVSDYWHFPLTVQDTLSPHAMTSAIFKRSMLSILLDQYVKL